MGDFLGVFTMRLERMRTNSAKYPAERVR